MTRYQKFKNNLAWSTLSIALGAVSALARLALYEDEAKSIDLLREGVRGMKV